MSFFRPGLEIDETLNQSIGDAPKPTLWQSIAAYFTERAERRAARVALAGLDARTLHDIGLTRQMVEFELSQPSSQPIRDRRS
jgi:uncharacterized protein YjiS (DUF1127 family)